MRENVIGLYELLSVIVYVVRTENIILFRGVESISVQRVENSDAKKHSSLAS